MIKVKLLRPLDGKAEGGTAEYPDLDAKRLERRGAVEIIGKVKEAQPTENKMADAPTNKDVQRATKRKSD